MKAIEQVHSSCPNARWWIKADATDVQEGLRESMKGQWSGDTDLGDGQLKKLSDEYNRQLSMIKTIYEKGNEQYMSSLLITLQKDRIFLKRGKEQAQKTHNMKKKQEKASEHAVFALAWEVQKKNPT